MPPVEMIVKFPKLVTIHNFLFTMFGLSLFKKEPDTLQEHSNMVIDTKIPVMSCTTYTLHV